MLPETALHASLKTLTEALAMYASRHSGQVSAYDLQQAEGLLRYEIRVIARETPRAQDRAHLMRHQAGNPAAAEAMDALLAECQQLASEAEAALAS
jgi:hypothetical protein